MEDYLGAFAVTAGADIEPLLERFQQDHDDYNSIMTKALADPGEALAELMHKGPGGSGVMARMRTCRPRI